MGKTVGESVSLELRGEGWIGGIIGGVISLRMVFKVVSLGASF